MTTYDTATMLPLGEVFQSPHSTPWHHQIAQANTVLLTQVGSGLHGVHTPDQDDRDEMGVCIEPPEVMLGHDRFDLYEFRSQAQHVRSGPGDLDLNVYGLSKFTKLLAAGNPMVLMLLFAPRSEVVRIRWPGIDLRERRDMFISRAAGARFLGYLERQRERFRGSLSQRTNRPELVEKYGYDSKFAYHALRLGLQGIELMTTGEINLPMLEPHRQYLLRVRRGEFSREDVDRRLDSVHADLEAAVTASRLPEAADWPAVSAWCAQTYRTWWEETGQ
ncbi:MULTISPECIES: DNA polymerase beta superfamily protein [unclassified Mycobacterium]|uniref:nucleotidyltransferase domain-containing protein n=1 Tax=unclassified Mycobacterium TaxID=2642494 RepID=UPI0029C68351|nr:MULTISPECIES: nucleotidyltransferase domain-containing protein [unclassified Mycobacterium]